MNENPHIDPVFSAEDEKCLTLRQMKDYQQGLVTGEEKDYVERHLLHCDLCAMAYEGIQELEEEEVAAGAAAIADAAWNRIANKEEKKRRTAYYWISAAAAVVILIVGTFLLMKGPEQQHTSNQNTFAEGGERVKDHSTEEKEATEEELDEIHNKLNDSNKLNDLIAAAQNNQGGSSDDAKLGISDNLMSEDVPIADMGISSCRRTEEFPGEIEGR